MAPIRKSYPRATAKKIAKAHSNCGTTKNLDVLVSRLYPREGEGDATDAFG